MHYPICILTTGIPGSGKSTWANETADRFPFGEVKTVCMDDLRAMLDRNYDGGRFSKQAERFVKNVQDQIIEASLKAGNSIIVHNTHVHPKSANQIKALCDADGFNCYLVDFPINPAIAHERNEARERTVPADVIERMHRTKLENLGSWGDWDVVTPEKAFKMLKALQDQKEAHG